MHRSRPILALVPFLVSAFAAAPLAGAKTFKVPAKFATIQAAVDAADGDDVIQIARGTYTESITLTGKQNIVIKGKGKVILDAGGADHALTLDGCTGVTLTNFRVRNAAISGIFVNGGAAIVVRKVKLLSGLPIGLDATGVSASTFDDVRSENQVTSALRVDGTACHVENLNLVNTTGTALDLRGPRHFVEKCTIDGATFGIDVQDGIDPSTGVVIDDNDLRNCSSAGVQFQCVRGVMRRNTVTNAGTAGLTINSSGDENVLEDNVVIGSTSRGISISGGRNTLANNRVDGAGTEGIALVQAQSLDNLVFHNTVQNCGGTGYFVQGTGNAVVGNVSAANATDYVNFGSDPTNTSIDNSFDVPVATGAVIHVPTDQTTIAAAITAAGLNDVIELAPGTYAEAVDLTAKSDVTIRGAAAGGDAIIDAAAGITLSGSPRVHLENLVVRNATGVAIQLGLSSDNVVLDHVRVEGGATSSLTATASKRLSVRDCTFANGAVLDVAACHVRGCTFDGGVDGLTLSSRQVIIETSTIRNTSGIGVKLGKPAPSSFGLLLDANVVQATGAEAVKVVASVSSVVIRKNTIGPTPSNGISIDTNVEGVVASANTLVDCATAGVIALDEENTVVGNSAKRCATAWRLSGSGASRNSLFANKAKKSTSNGFLIDGDANVTIGNRTKKSGSAPYLDNNPGGLNLAFDNFFKS